MTDTAPTQISPMLELLGGFIRELREADSANDEQVHVARRVLLAARQASEDLGFQIDDQGWRGAAGRKQASWLDREDVAWL